MRNRFSELVNQLQSYRALSPDLGMRAHVNQQLRQRSCLAFEDWFARLRSTHPISIQVAAFAYEYLPRYSGLAVSCILPSDRLEEDLRWSLVCWFDWELCLCEDFYRQTKVDISEGLFSFTPYTIGDLISFLHSQCSKSVPS